MCWSQGNRIGIPPMLSHIQHRPWTGYTIELKDHRGQSKWYKPLVCEHPDCDNADPEMFDLYSTDLDTCRWFGQKATIGDSMAYFEYGKSVFTDISEIKDTFRCRECDHEFTATGYAYDLT